MIKVAPDDGRPPLAQAAAWASRVMTVALEMVLPGVLGIWIDRQLGYKAAFTLVGFGIGFSVALWHLLQLTKHNTKRRENTGENQDQIRDE